MRRIKMGADVENILRHVRDGDLFVQLGVEPETRLRYTLPYMDSMPAFLLVEDNQYLTSPLYEATFKAPTPPPDSMDLDKSKTTKCMDPYMKPSHAAEVVEPVLDRARARQWTNVISDDGLFRRLITMYLAHQHATFFWFKKELFLEDLVARRTQFCSSLLVNAVLAAACVSNQESQISRYINTFSKLTRVFLDWLNSGCLTTSKIASFSKQNGCGSSKWAFVDSPQSTPHKFSTVCLTAMV